MRGVVARRTHDAAAGMRGGSGQPEALDGRLGAAPAGHRPIEEELLERELALEDVALGQPYFVLDVLRRARSPTELAKALGCNKSTAYGRVRTLRQRFAQHARGDEMLEHDPQDPEYLLRHYHVRTHGGMDTCADDEDMLRAMMDGPLSDTLLRVRVADMGLGGEVPLGPVGGDHLEAGLELRPPSRRYR